MIDAPLAPVLAHLRCGPSRTWSIVITVFGDAVLPRGGTLWLGSLLEIFAALGIAGGVVRTAMSRLAADGWLTRHRAGRHSFYRLTDKGRRSFLAASAVIYGPEPPAWDSRFHLLFETQDTDREALRPVLEAAGFGSPAPGVWIAPQTRSVPPEAAALPCVLGAADTPSGRQLAARAWALEQTASAYLRFIEAFEPLRIWLAAGGVLGELDALVARLLLVHAYRRIVLRDPRLPLALLPRDWPGSRARQVCAAIYRQVLPGAEAWLDRRGRDENGPLPAPDATLAARFENPAPRLAEG